METCSANAIRESKNGKVRIDRKLCTICTKCTEICPSKAITVMGKFMSIDDILDVVEGDDNFYWRSGGGITVGGGDPVYQADTTRQLLSKCKESGIDTAIETAGYANFVNLEKICQHANSILYDIKHIDPVKHKTFTGVTNELILDNLKRLSDAFPKTPITVRTPVIPGFNDSEEVIESIVYFLKGIRSLLKYELLPYHSFGEAKYYKLGRNYSLKGLQPPDKEYMERLKKIVYKAGLG
jgi:pyruvate formate lyase activating enzyme